MNEKKTEKLYNSITNISEDIIEEAQNGGMQKKRSSWRRWTAWTAAAAAVCLLAAGASAVLYLDKNAPHKVQQWSSGFEAKNYFRYNKGEGLTTAEKSDMIPPYVETRFFSDERRQLEADKVIPVMESHPLFTCAAYYNDDGSLFSLEFMWNRRDAYHSEELKEYSDLKITAGYQEVEMISDCIYVELDENGNIVEPSKTVTERDGIQIVTEGKEDRNKTMTFQNDSGWYQVSGSFNDDYESVAALLDWLWEHPVDFSRFSMEAGDEYRNGSPEEFQN